MRISYCCSKKKKRCESTAFATILFPLHSAHWKADSGLTSASSPWMPKIWECVLGMGAEDRYLGFMGTSDLFP